MYDNPAYVTLQPFAYIFLQLGKMGQKHEVKEKVGITRQAGGMRSAYFILGNTFVPRSEGGEGGAEGGGRWLVDLVLMLEQKNDEKGYFFFKLGSAQCCHRLGSEKRHFSGKRVGFLKSDRKNAVIRGKIQTENIVERIPVFIYILSTLFRICCSSNCTKMIWKRTPPTHTHTRPPTPDLFTYSRLLT